MIAPDDDGLLYGIKDIAAHLKLTPRQVERLVHQHHLPTFRLGTRICSTKQGLSRHFANLVDLGASG